MAVRAENQVTRTGSQSSRYLGGRESSVALAKVCCFTRRGQRFALGLKIEGQKDRIGHVVGIAGGGSNVSRGEEIGQGGQC